MNLIQIQQRVHNRVLATVSTHPTWPCHKGCGDCCRTLASEPHVSEPEWQRIDLAIRAHPNAQALYDRIRAGAAQPRPATCALLDTATGDCVIYQARPIVCRAYGFYAERDNVLACPGIADLAAQDSAILWGNHTALEADLATLGPARPFSAWLPPSDPK